MSDNNNLPSPQEFAKLIENQSRELSIKEKEIDLEREKTIAAQRTDERQFEFAKEHLATLAQDRKNDREYKRVSEGNGFVIAIIFILAVGTFLITAVLNDKDQMIVEIVKALAYGVPSGIGGYAWGALERKMKMETSFNSDVSLGQEARGRCCEGVL
jgi:hypothetical protein